MWHWNQGWDRHPRNGPTAGLIDATHHAQQDPADPWEVLALPERVAEIGAQGFRGHPYRPATFADVPTEALEALSPALGDLGPEQVFVFPLAARPVDMTGRRWVETPLRVLGVGAERVALWVDDPERPGLRATIPFAEVVAIMDLTVLLLGRLEIVGEHAGFVVRYNAVNRPDLRDLLLPVRRSFPEVAVPPVAASDLDDLPLKWRNVARSKEMLPAGAGALHVVQGAVPSSGPRIRGGIAAVSMKEVLLATEPSAEAATSAYGIDLIAIPRHRVHGVSGDGERLVVSLESDGFRTMLAASAEASLAASIRQRLPALLS